MATASRNAHEGLYRSRDPRYLQLHGVRSQWTNAPNEYFHIISDSEWEREVTMAPLCQRRWVLQERILPPRALHFGEHRLLWECMEIDACEKYPAAVALKYTIERGGMKYSAAEVYRKYTRDKTALWGEIKAVYELWNKWVNTYSTTQLTRNSDKLIAFSGLAKKMRALTNDKYLAGLWERRFVDQLLWQAMYRDSKKLKPEDCRVPSWSWVSVSGSVVTSIYHPGSIYHMEVDDVKVTPVAEDDTGCVVDGEIRARGLQLEAQARNHPRSNQPER